MADVYTIRQVLSGSTNGRPIKVAATSTPGTTIHTATTGGTGTDVDYLTLWATCSHTAAVNLTLQWGGTTDPDDLIVDARSIPNDGAPYKLVEDLPIQNGLLVRAFAATTNVIIIGGSVLRVSDA